MLTKRDNYRQLKIRYKLIIKVKRNISEAKYKK
jgi:hypothetical protein